MTKLWAKGYSLHQVVEEYMTGDDPNLDLVLGHYDCVASLAHAQMLYQIGVLTKAELALINRGLDEIKQLLASEQFVINPSDEDIHTAIENYLTSNYGVVGKKIHTARSRNDQVLTALRLYTKDQLLQTLEQLATTAEVLLNFAKHHQNIPYPGRTHYQKAMPSSIGLWMGAQVEALLDDAELLWTSLQLNDQSPLGSAASYGVALPIDRQLCAELMGFAKVQNNVLYANNSRGKLESVVIHSLTQVMLDLAKLASDVILFSAPEMGYLELPLQFCPGSSLMPNKKNPDPFELIRAKSATVMGNLMQVLTNIRGLPSGYNRDFQETKRPLMESFTITKSSLAVTAIILEQVTVNESACRAAFSPDVFATDQVVKLVQSGVPFREAYQQVAAQLTNLSQEDPVANILAKTHLGAPGNLGLEAASARIAQLRAIVAGGHQ